MVIYQHLTQPKAIIAVRENNKGYYYSSEGCTSTTGKQAHVHGGAWETHSDITWTLEYFSSQGLIYPKT